MCGPSQSKSGEQALAFPTHAVIAITLRRSRLCPGSEQRRDLANLDRAEQHRAVDEAQREAARLLAFQHGLAAERVDAGGDADIGVLLHHLAEAGNRAVERAEETVEVLRLD